MTEISNANSVLSRPEQKLVYDRWGSKGIYAGTVLGGFDRVNRITMFALNVSGSIPETLEMKST